MVERTTRWPRPMQIGRLAGLHRNAPDVERPLPLPEPARRLDRRPPGQPPLRNHPVLDGVKQPLDSARSLRRVAGAGNPPHRPFDPTLHYDVANWVRSLQDLGLS